jgi:hypothetical protein
MAERDDFKHIEEFGVGVSSPSDHDWRIIKSLINLRELNLIHCGMTEAGLVHPQGLTRLKRLELPPGLTTGPGLVHLKRCAIVDSENRTRSV